MSSAVRSFVPAAGHAAALPLYDPLVRLLGFDRLRARLLEQANVASGQQLLDIGCGTGSLAVQLKQRFSDARVAALDPDPGALGEARKKAARAGVIVQFTQGFADRLPWADGSVDHVFSSFMLHHLSADQKRAMLAEVRRVLAPAGAFHFVDFVDQPRDKSLLVRVLHLLGAAHHLPQQSDVELRALFAEARLSAQNVGEHQLGWFGGVVFYRAQL